MQIFHLIFRIFKSIFRIFSVNKKKKAEKPTPETAKASDKTASPALTAAVAALKRNGILIETSEEETVRPDQSKIGGLPYLPADFVWPTYTDAEGVTHALSFLCQINLAETAEFDKEHLLPESGLLAFFYDCESFLWGFDPADRGSARVFCFENAEGFVPREIPEEICEEYTLPELSVSFSTTACYPAFDEASVYGMDCDWEDYDAAREELGAPEGEERHLMLGYADVIQNEMLTDCECVTRNLYCGDGNAYRALGEQEKAEIAEAAKDWTLLLQLSTIEKDDFELMWGDCGMLYFYMKKEDLAARRFENAWFALQCG